MIVDEWLSLSLSLSLLCLCIDYRVSDLLLGVCIWFKAMFCGQRPSPFLMYLDANTEIIIQDTLWCKRLVIGFLWIEGHLQSLYRHSLLQNKDFVCGCGLWKYLLEIKSQRRYGWGRRSFRLCYVCCSMSTAARAQNILALSFMVFAFVCWAWKRMFG